MLTGNNVTSDIVSVDDIKKQIDSIVLTNKQIATNQLNEIIRLLPTEISHLINNAFIYKRTPKEYLLSSILFAYSNAAGLAFNIKCMNYTNYANLYFAIVGSRGDVKSPAMDLATKPLNEYDNQHYIEYKERQREATNNALNDTENEEINRKQLFLQDATIEAAMFTHLKNKNSIGIFIDELFYLIEKMANKNSNDGNAWRTFLLQGSTNKHIDVARKTTESYRIEKSYPTLLGSIQHQFIPKMFANGNLESGLIDRLLFVTKLTSNDKLTKDILPFKITENYNNSISNLLNYRNSIEAKIIKPKLDSFNVTLSSNAENEIYDYSQKLINTQKKLTDYSSEYISKMLINIHKLTLLSHLMFSSSTSNFQSKINAKSVDLAILLNEFYFTNFKIVLEHKNDTIDSKILTSEIIKLAKKNGVNQQTIVSLTKKSKSQISKLWNKK